MPWNTDKILILKIQKEGNLNQLKSKNNIVEIMLIRTALHLATCSGNEESVRILLKAGAEVNIWDSKNKATPLHCASSKGHTNCLKMLLQHGADVNAGLTSRSPLHYAVQNLEIECVKLLLEAGAIPHSPQVLNIEDYIILFFILIIYE